MYKPEIGEMVFDTFCGEAGIVIGIDETAQTAKLRYCFEDGTDTEDAPFAELEPAMKEKDGIK